jgi:hypothetical protein
MRLPDTEKFIHRSAIGSMRSFYPEGTAGSSPVRSARKMRKRQARAGWDNTIEARYEVPGLV